MANPDVLGGLPRCSPLRHGRQPGFSVSGRLGDADIPVRGLHTHGSSPSHEESSAFRRHQMDVGGPSSVCSIHAQSTQVSRQQHCWPRFYRLRALLRLNHLQPMRSRGSEVEVFKFSGPGPPRPSLSTSFWTDFHPVQLRFRAGPYSSRPEVQITPGGGPSAHRPPPSQQMPNRVLPMDRSAPIALLLSTLSR